MYLNALFVVHSIKCLQIKLVDGGKFKSIKYKV